ncbi:hypothetical protein [Halorussus salinisoli]|uniref:hypothetical protein n=1 Tax=Halorussus salinisoli TaxID=2558242 RepID=UPI0010C20149|nr:hypothetical protein [Halorussus salinisoli]
MTDSVHSALFFVGVFLITAAVVVGVGAFEYEVRSLGAVEEIPEVTESLVSYDALSERDQRTVDQILAGERLVVRDPGYLPGPREAKGQLAVERDGETYLLTRRLFFDWRTRFGASAVTMVVAGVVAISEAIRRHHCPHRSVFWT